MWDPLMKLFQKSDLQKSADLVAELEQLEKTWPAIEARYFELDKKCCEISHRLEAAIHCRSRTAPALDAELGAASIERDRGTNLFNHKRDQLRCQLEALTAPTIRAFIGRCNEWQRQIWAQRRSNVLERRYDAGSDTTHVRLAHNAGTVKEAQDYVTRMQAEVRSMQHRPLQEVQEKIAEVTASVEKFDFDKLTPMETSESFVPDFAAESISTNTQYDKEWLVPTTQYTDSRRKWQIEETNKRIEKARRA
jgi:hypothetical protein